jgi:hypothetical protein
MVDKRPSRAVDASRASGSLTQFPALNASAAKQLAVLLLRHALATLLDH